MKQKFIFSSIVLFLLMWICIGIYNRSSLENNNFIVIGKIIKVDIPGWKRSGDFSITYEYFVNDHKYSGSGNYTRCKRYRFNEARKLLIQREVPIAINIKNYDHSVMILTLNDAKKFNYADTEFIYFIDTLIRCR